VRGPELADRLRSYPEGSKATITVFRNDRLRECRVTVGSASVPAYTVAPHKAPSEDQRAVYRSWLEGK
jgi:predicted metalloprotease with PDZ domain